MLSKIRVGVKVELNKYEAAEKLLIGQFYNCKLMCIL